MQNLYETLLIITPDADEERVSAVIGDLRVTIENDDGVVLQAGVWERRKLAYAVKGKTEGIYVLIYADGNNTLPAALKDRMRLDESVIRSMVVRLEDKHEADVRQQLAEVDHTGDVAEIEAQRIAAEKRHEAEAAAAAMSLDEIAAAEEAEAALIAGQAEATEESTEGATEEAESDVESDVEADVSGSDESVEVAGDPEIDEVAEIDEGAEEAPAGEAAPAEQDTQAADPAEPEEAAEAPDSEGESGDTESDEDAEEES